MVSTGNQLHFLDGRAPFPTCRPGSRSRETRGENHEALDKERAIYIYIYTSLVVTVPQRTLFLPFSSTEVGDVFI